MLRLPYIRTRISKLRASQLTLLLLIAGLPAVLVAALTLIDFEGFPDSTILTNQYPGSTFSNAVVLTAGITLNEFEFPTHSPVNVVSDNGGSMTLNFSPPVQNFSGYFTHSLPLTLKAFNAANSQIATANSHFGNNEGLSGDSGSSPNELIQISSTAGIAKLTIAGDPAGQSFALDDATPAAQVSPAPTPLPPTLVLLLSAVALVGLAGYALRRKAKNPFITAALIGALLLPLGYRLVWFSAAAQTSGRSSPTTRIGSLIAKPTAITVNTPTPVDFTATVEHPSLIPDSVTLVRFDESGVPTIIGAMHHDGTGSARSDSHGHKLRVYFNELRSGSLQFRISAAFRGQIRRVSSPLITLTVSEPAR